MTRIRLSIYASLVLVCLLSACGKEPGGRKQSQPAMDGIYAYVAMSDAGYQDIYLQNQDGTENISSTWTIMNPSRPRLSADGRTLLFQGQEKGRWGIYVYDITTGKLPLCLSAAIPQDCRYPDFTTDGRVVFSKGGQIAILDMRDLSFKPVTFDASVENTFAVVSPDCRSCFYLSGKGSSACIIKTDLSTNSSLSVSNTAGANSLAVGKNGELVYTLAGKGLFADGTLLSSDCRAVTGVFGDWAFCQKTVGFAVCNLRTGEAYPLTLPECSEAVYADARVSISKPEDGGRVRGKGDIIESDTERPMLKGKMVYHNYTSYSEEDSKMYLYDFATNKLQTISSGWTTVRHAMNGHFSNDGRTVTFMGIGTDTDSWDIFIYELGSGKQPENLTPKGKFRDEDPKFSFDGSRICFKRDGQLSEIDVRTKNIRALSNYPDIDFGMPYYSVSGDRIVFGGSRGSETFIGCWDIGESRMTTLYDKAGTTEYYPITIDGDSFYYTGHISATNPYDQLYIGYWDGREPQYLPFNKTNADYSDACPVSSGWLILCSTRQDSRGQYDLYIANCRSGAIYSLSDYNQAINTGLNELGASYCPPQ